MYLSAALGGLLVPFVTAFPANTRSTECTPETAVLRKEWSSMRDDDRKSYVSAIQCLMEKPSRYETGVVPASNSLFSDFAASHANVSLSIHQTGTFLSWHREFLHLMEEALHNECNYPAHLGLPYWDWPAYLDRPLDRSTLFDGSETSLGSNGASVPDRPPWTITPEESNQLNREIPPGATIPRGSGGGCIEKGPFANTQVYLGPFPPPIISSGLPPNWTEPNPQCLTRDLNDWALRTFNDATRVDSLLSATNIEDFQYGFNPIHRGGHITVGGQLADFYVSPLEPAFYLHHGQIDRLWTIWQAEDEARRMQFNGTSTFQNPVGESPEVAGHTVITFVPLGESIQLKDAANPMGGRYCYRYV
ncbi:hypothetical protein FQN54_009277 [Arachnomyces sp. PD_36]|nr:hypothetical protein FQN54_009277 [Arachnomyces sp. PD_36]